MRSCTTLLIYKAESVGIGADQSIEARASGRSTHVTCGNDGKSSPSIDCLLSFQYVTDIFSAPEKVSYISFAIRHGCAGTSIISEFYIVVLNIVADLIHSRPINER